MKLRAANFEDTIFLFELRNESQARRQSFEQKEIDLVTHEAWFRKKIEDANTLILVAEDEDLKIGQIRFDREGERAEVSIAVVPDFRDRGYGSQILIEGCRLAFTKFFLKAATAHIKTQNGASIAAFKKAGFFDVGLVSYKGHVCMEMLLLPDRLPQMEEAFFIGRCRIGTSSPTFIVAEMSANHRQDLNEAIQIIREAKQAGADAVKIQTYTPDTITLCSSKEHFRIGKGTIWEGKTLFELYKEAYTPWEWHSRLKEVAEEEGLIFFSTPFDMTAVDFLEELDVPAFKIASFEIVDFPLMRRIGRTKKPVIVSTGMASLEEIKEAVNLLQGEGCTHIALLKCASAYPAPDQAMHLRTIPQLANTFQVPVGLSDHTLGIEVPIAAVALGARIIEKHFTLSRSNPSPDSTFSLEPQEFGAMVRAIRRIEAAMGEVHYGPTDFEKQNLIFRRSLFIVRDIKKGEVLTTHNVRSIRPAHGLPPKYFDQILGEKVSCDLEAGTPLAWNHIGRLSSNSSIENA